MTAEAGGPLACTVSVPARYRLRLWPQGRAWLSGGGSLDGAAALGARRQVAQPADLLGPRAIGGGRGEDLLQKGRENLPLTRIEHRECLAENGGTGVQHLRRRANPLITEDHRDRAVIAAWSPFRPALGNELIDDTYRGRLRPG